MLISTKYSTHNLRNNATKFIVPLGLLLFSWFLVTRFDINHVLFIFVGCNLASITIYIFYRFKVGYFIKRNPVILVWLIFFVGFLSIGSFNSPESLLENPFSNRMIRITTIIIGGIIAFVILFEKRIFHKIFKGFFGLLLLYFVVSLVSSINSSYIWLSIFKSTEILFCVMALGTLYVCKDISKKPGLLIIVTAIFFLFLVLILWIEALILPASAFVLISGETPFLSTMLRGIWPVINPNTVGYIGGIVAIISFLFLINVKKLKQKIIYFILFLIGSITIYYSYSRAAIIAFPITLALSLIICKRYSKALLLIIVIALAIIFLPRVNVLQEYIKRGQNVDNILEITRGRLNVWQSAFEKGKETMLIGHGYAVGFRYADWTAWGHAHSSPVEIFYGMGILGLIVWFVILFKLFRFLIVYLIKYKNHMSNDGFALHISAIALLSFSFLRSLFGSYMVYFNYSFMVLASIVFYCEQLRRIESQKAKRYSISSLNSSLSQ